VVSDAATIFKSVPEGTPVLTAYQDLADQGKLNYDEHQVKVLQTFQDLQDELEAHVPSAPPTAPAEAAQGGGFFSSMFGGKSEPVQVAPISAPMGAYVWGGPGCGKSFCMDLFFQCVKPSAGGKKRVHFNEFMLDVHQRLHRLNKLKDDQTVPTVAAELVSEGWLLCFDEFQVTDIADAMIVKRVFDEMFSKGAVMIATSNRSPRDLYLNGLQRNLFLPFIDQLEAHCHVANVDSDMDYRLLAEAGAGNTFIHPADDKGLLDQAFKGLAKGETGRATKVQTRSGRKVDVPMAAAGVARFTFSELCERPLGASDYMVIAQAFHTVLVDDIPQMIHHLHYNECRRFILFVDQLYEHKVKLLCAAAAPPPLLYVAAEGMENPTYQRDEVFAFERCVSRLMEMQSEGYLGAPHQPKAAAPDETLRIEVMKLSSEGVKGLFDKYDSNGDGLLMKTDIKDLLEDLAEARDGHRNVVDEAIEATFSIIDTDGSGGIDWDEFCDYCATHGIDRNVEHR